GRRLRRWVAPVGIAAGVVMVASAVLVLRPLDPSGSSSQLAAAPATATAALQPPLATALTSAPVSQDIIRLDRGTLQEAQLERYLSAHRQFQGSTLLSPSPAYLRSAAYETGVQP
ncbi:MAG: hypothetical protein RJA44_2666, partial [Pseudomonadota bacterium]